MDVVILGGGLGTRFKELSVFPKVLLPSLEYDSILLEELTYFSGKKWLIVNERYGKMVADYIKANDLENQVELITSNNTNGSLNTLASVYSKLPKKDVLFFWSDILVPGGPKIENVTKNTIFTAAGNYRYKFDGNVVTNVSKSYDGNVPGIYYLEDISGIIPEVPVEESLDLVDKIKEKIDSGTVFDKVEVSGLVEYRDLESYVKIMRTYKPKKNTCRFFNKLEFEGDTVKKTSIVDSYDKVIEDENMWYKILELLNMSGYDKLPCPKVGTIFYDRDNNPSFRMENCIGYVTLYEFLSDPNVKDTSVIKVYENIKAAIETLEKHKYQVSTDVFVADLTKEVITKVIDRCEKIKNMLVNYNKDELYTTLVKAYYMLFKKNDNGTGTVEYSLCHGDLNGSNILVNPSTYDIKFIDPRGYFGNTKEYSWNMYEYAKLRYALEGYDKFNTGRYIYKFDKPEESKFIKKVEDIIPELSTKEVKVLVGVIYVALGGYISQDIMKANIAYEYGLELLKREL